MVKVVYVLIHIILDNFGIDRRVEDEGLLYLHVLFVFWQEVTEIY